MYILGSHTNSVDEIDISSTSARYTLLRPNLNNNITYVYISFCMVCAYVWEHNPQALACRCKPMQNHMITCLLHQHAFAFCALRGIDVRYWNVNVQLSQTKLWLILM